MEPNAVLDAAQLVAMAGTATAIVVQLVKMFLGAESARAKVATAVFVATALTLLYGASNGLLALENGFALTIAAITIAATGAGAQHAISATAKTGQ